MLATVVNTRATRIIMAIPNKKIIISTRDGSENEKTPDYLPE